MSKSSTDMVLDGIRSPVDRVAARVMRNGVHWTPNKNVQTADQRVPHELRNPLSIAPEHRRLIGHKFGRMTVLGMSFERAKDHALWSVRCGCGIYTLRSAKAIRNPNNNWDCCEACRHLLYLKRKDIWKRTGKTVFEGSLP